MRNGSKALHTVYLLIICLLGLFMSHDPGYALSPLGDPIGVDQKASRLSKEQQQQLEYFYLLKDPTLWKALDLSPVQRVKLDVYERRLSYLPVRFVSDGRHSDVHVAAMNTPRKQLERCTDLGRIVADALTRAQKADFQEMSRHRSLQPVEVYLEPESITVVLKFGTRGKVARISLHNKEKIGDPGGDATSAKLADMLKTFPDVREAILDKDNTVQAVGVRALSTLPVKNVDPRDKAAVAGALLEFAQSSETGIIREEDLMKSLPKVVDASHKRELLELSRNASRIRMRGVVAGLSRVAPEEAIALAASRIDDSSAFSNALEGFVMHGSDAEPHLVKLNKVTKEKQRYLVQNALDRIRNAGGKPAKKKGTLQATPWPQKRSPLKVPPPRTKGSSSGGAATVSDWLQDLRSDDRCDQGNALDRYEWERDSLNLMSLSSADKAELAKLCGARLKAETSPIRGDRYGKLLFEVADRSSVPLFEKLAYYREDYKRLYGLAGLMKFSQEKALKAGLNMEPTTFGIFNIVKAAKLVGPDSVPTLKALKGKLKDGSNHFWIDKAIKELK